MSCDRERQRLDAAVAVLSELWDELASAAPPHKPDIVAQIEAQNAVVDRAKAEYETCIHKDDLPRTSKNATFSLISLRSSDPRIFFNEQNVSRIFRFSGPATSREFGVDPIVVTRTAVFTIRGIHGGLVPATGAMHLDAAVDIELIGRRATLNISAGTDPSTSPGGLFTMLGKPLDPSDNSFRLVGTGSLDYAEAAIFALQYAIAFDGTFDSAP